VHKNDKVARAIVFLPNKRSDRKDDKVADQCGEAKALILFPPSRGREINQKKIRGENVEIGRASSKKTRRRQKTKKINDGGIPGVIHDGVKRAIQLLCSTSKKKRQRRKRITANQRLEEKIRSSVIEQPRTNHERRANKHRQKQGKRTKNVARTARWRSSRVADPTDIKNERQCSLLQR